MSRYPYVDRNPCIVAAGKPIGDPYANVKQLLQDIKLEDKIDAIRKQFGMVDAKGYYTECIKTVAPDTSGAFTEIRHCLRKPEPTPFEAIDEEIKNTIYDSYWNKALGKGRDPTPGLPRGMNPYDVAFGKSVERSEPAGEIINPRKKAEQVEQEERDFHKMYAFSHQNYYAGEQIKQGYAPPFNECNFYGKPCKKDDSGERVKRSLTWFNNDPISNVSRRQAAVRNRTLPPLGKALDKTGVTNLFPDDHVYGKPTIGSFYGVEDLLKECAPSLVRRDMLVFLAYANKIRQGIYQKINSGEIVLEELYYEIVGLNKDRKKDETDCFENYDCIDRILKRHKIFLDRSKIEPLLFILGLMKEDGTIKVRDFVDFLDKNRRFPEMKKEHYILPPEFQNCSSFDSESEKPKRDLRRMPPAGKPSIRLDRNQPSYRDSITNMDHLGEETTARTVICPSIYSQYGLSHRDFFKPRSKEFLDNLFKKIDVTLSEEKLDEIYKEGYELDQSGGVCVETFRNLLDERAYNAYNKL